MIVPIEVATNGYIGTGLNTLSITADGYLITVTITNVPSYGGGYLVKGTTRVIRRREREKRRKDPNYKPEEQEEEEIVKKITVIVTYNNEAFIETKYVEDMPDLTVEDVDVQVVETDNKPKITITVIKK